MIKFLLFVLPEHLLTIHTIAIAHGLKENVLGKWN
jgi:hypothetical protein